MNPRMNRRAFLVSSAGAVATMGADPPAAPKRIAGVVTVHTLNSHADVIIGRLIQGYNLNNTGGRPNLKLVSLYTDQSPANELSRNLARKYGFYLAPTIAEALTLGGKDLAVDGVILVGEHGNYPVNAKGQTLYPRRRFFEETVKVFRRSRRVVPVFSDKHLSARWEDAKWMYDTARELKIPFMAGSSLPGLWRRPPRDVSLGADIAEIVATSYHTLDAYGFHALEMVQCLAERRRGGETGLAAVRCVAGPEVWKLGEHGVFDRRLLDAALARCERAGRGKEKIEDVERNPILCLLEYRDGLKASVLTFQTVGEWAVAWRTKRELQPEGTLFWTQEARPFGHFTFLVQGIEQMMWTGKPTWPVERTLLTTGALDALLTSKLQKGVRLETPELAIAYAPTHAWKEPPPPPADRPLTLP